MARRTRTRKPARMEARTCRWLAGNPIIDLRHGFPACLRVKTVASTQDWLVSVTPTGVRVTEEVHAGRYLPSHEIDTSFGPEVEHWECDCAEFRPRCVRRSEAGCLHCRVAFNALKAIGAV